MSPWIIAGIVVAVLVVSALFMRGGGRKSGYEREMEKIMNGEKK